jgi:hypothetical protein
MQTLHRPDIRNKPTCGSFPAVRSASDRTMSADTSHVNDPDHMCL